MGVSLPPLSHLREIGGRSMELDPAAGYVVGLGEGNTIAINDGNPGGLALLDDDEKGYHIVATPGGPPNQDLHHRGWPLLPDPSPKGIALGDTLPKDLQPQHFQQATGARFRGRDDVQVILGTCGAV